MQPLITVAPDGQRAWVRSRALSELGTFGAVGVWGDGVYENEFVKENGVWKFKHDHVFTTFFAPYEPGWAMGARADAEAQREDSAGPAAERDLREPARGLHPEVSLQESR